MSTTFQPRAYQLDLENRTFDAWGSGARCVLVRLPTGGGKTVVVGRTVKRFDRPAVVAAHRKELVANLSIALARVGVRHRVIAPKEVARDIIRDHVDKVGRNHVDPNAIVCVASVDTLVRDNDPWIARSELFVPDEGHHVLRENKWGACYAKMPNARGLFPTATPGRADGCGLGRHADGFVDVMLEGPQMRDLIDWGYLVDYRVVWCESSIDRSRITTSAATGDLNEAQNRAVTHESRRLVGDTVREYLKWTPGALGMTFAVDVESAKELAEAYRAAGVPAEAVSAKTPHALRRDIMRRYERRDILQLVNVDLYGEGVDVPACEVVSMARATGSRNVHDQQIGRMLRLAVGRDLDRRWEGMTPDERKAAIAASGKPRGWLIDHVDNIGHHGLPDRRCDYTLDRRERRAKADPDVIPLRRCLNPACALPYEAVHKCCPHCLQRVCRDIECGTVFDAALAACPVCATPTSATRGRTITEVEGDLTEADPALLAQLRGEVARIDGPVRVPQHLERSAAMSLTRKHGERQQAQEALRHAIDTWAAVHGTDDDATRYRRFFHTFGVDVVSACALNAADATALRERVAARIASHGYAYQEVDHE